MLKMLPNFGRDAEVIVTCLDHQKYAAISDGKMGEKYPEMWTLFEHRQSKTNPKSAFHSEVFKKILHVKLQIFKNKMY